MDRAPGSDRPSTADDGATAVEYALMLLFIAAVLFAVLGALGLDVMQSFQPVEAGIDGVPNG